MTGSIAALVQGIPLPALLIGRDLRIRACNDGATAILGACAIGGHVTMMLRQPGVLEAIEACQRTGLAQRARYLGADAGQDANYDVSCTPVEGGVLICLADVSRSLQIDRMRRDFVANVSHELRTPLTALTGLVETLQGPARGDLAASDRFLAMMQDEAARMERLVQALLALSRVEGQQRQRPRVRVDLGRIAQEATDALSPMAAAAGVNLTCHTPDTPLHILGDADQLRQLCTNLIENAVKYGGQGGRADITVTQQEQAVRLSVRDHGAGIDSLHVPRLTERFYRVDNHRSRQMGGTGLGLAIVKHIVNRHRGRLIINSTLGQGSEFCVVLPLAEASV